MPYAASGQIAADAFDGAIEITTEQYAEALAGMCEGLIVTIDDGFKVGPAAEPEAPAAPEPTLEELAVIAIARRDGLLALAAIRIAPLQDAIDLGNATPDEIVSLGLWKAYRVDLNRINQQGGFPVSISWPLVPGP